MPKIKIENHGMEIEARPGLSLLNNFMSQRAPIHTVCGGKARCGCCRIKVLAGAKGVSPVKPEEITRLGQVRIDEGWRLSCQSFALRDATVMMPEKQGLDRLCSQAPGN